MDKYRQTLEKIVKWIDRGGDPTMWPESSGLADARRLFYPCTECCGERKTNAVFSFNSCRRCWGTGIEPKINNYA
jgi:hypothetical protein